MGVGTFITTFPDTAMNVLQNTMQLIREKTLNVLLLPSVATIGDGGSMPGII